MAPGAADAAGRAGWLGWLAVPMRPHARSNRELARELPARLGVGLFLKSGTRGAGD